MRIAMALLGLLLGALAWPSAETERLLAQALWGPSRPYSGTLSSVVATGAGDVRSLVRVEGDGRGGVRRTFLDGPAKGLETLEVGGHIYSRADTGWAEIGHITPADRATAIKSILKAYAVKTSPPTTFLGRRAIAMEATPLRSFNPSRRWVVDAVTGLALKDEMFAPGGARRSLSQFTQIRFLDSIAAFVKPDARAPAAYGPGSFEPLASRDAMVRATGVQAVLPKHVPEGYRIAAYGIVQAANGRTMPAVRYSDGLSAFTVFERGGNRRRRGYGWGRPEREPEWRSDVQRSVVVAERPGRSFVLIGDLAESELQRVADSIP